MTELLLMIIPIFVIALITAAVVIISGEKFEKCLIFSLLMITLVLYYTQFIFHTFKYGLCLLILIPCVVIVINIIRASASRGGISAGMEIFLENYFSSGFFLFIIFTALIVFLDFNRQISYWDEYSHWGMMTKELLRLDTFYSDASTSRLLVHWEYPPFSPIFQMFWGNLSGGFSEMECFMATHVFSFALILPLISVNVDDDEGMLVKIARGVFLVLCCVFLVIFMDQSAVFFTLLQDVFFALLFVYGMTLVLDDGVYWNIFDTGSLLMISIALPLTKEMGKAFIIVLWFFYILKFIVKSTLNEFDDQDYSIVQNLASIGSIVCGTIVSVFLWNHYIDKLEVTDQQFSLSNISMNTLSEVLRGSAEEQLRVDTLHSYIEALFKTDITNALIPLSFIACTVLVFVLLAILWFLERKYNVERNAPLLAISFLCGTIGWAFTMGILYLFCFTEYEMIGLASYTRYMGPWIMAEILIMLAAMQRVLVYGRDGKRIRFRYLIPICIAFFIVLCSCDYKIFSPAFTKEVSHSYERNRAEMIESLTNGPVQVLLIQHDTIGTQYATNFFSEDVRYTLSYTDFLELDYSDEETLNSALELFAEQDYLCFVNMEDVVNDVIAKEIYGGNEIWMGYLYEVKHNDDGSIYIERVN